ncbi:hypothetical protein GBA52_004736 [Prunus armeniaca]|nr:hypothetical protein GBA52_004736 [Prunus armeniaca]
MLMDGSCIEDLQRMYTLFSRVNALESLRQALSSYIWRTGQEIITCESEDEEMVASPSKFKLSLDTIWEESFMKNLDFGKTIKNAFEHLQAKRTGCGGCLLWRREQFQSGYSVVVREVTGLPSSWRHWRNSPRLT